MEKIQWHPAFYGGIELELLEYQGSLDYVREYEISKKPLKMDLLIIKKTTDTIIDKSIARLFRGYNVIEYKSPEDSLNIDDFYKTIGYALFYKGMAEHVNEIPIEEITVSLFCYKYPRNMFKLLRQEGAIIHEQENGIHLVERVVNIPVQVVLLDSLPAEQYKYLCALSEKLDEERFKKFVIEASKLESQGEKNNLEAVLDVVVKANPDIYLKVKESQDMESSAKIILKERDDKIKREGTVEAVRKIMIKLKMSAEQAMEFLDIPKSEYDKYLPML